MLLIFIGLLLGFSNDIIIQWGRTNSTGIYWGHIVTFPTAFSSVVIPTSIINWLFTEQWYSGGETATLRTVTDVVGAPYDVTLTSMGLPSFSSHYWIVIGY